MERVFSSNLFNELYVTISNGQWEDANNAVELILAGFFYPQPIHEIFKSFWGRDMTDVLKDLQLLEAKEGQVIVKEGDEGDSMFIIVKGRARVTSKAEKEKLGIPLPICVIKHMVENVVSDGKVTLEEMGPGEIFGEMALFASGHRMATVTAVTDMDLIRLRRSALDKIFQRSPRFHEYLLSLYSGHINDLVEKLKHAASNRVGLLGTILDSLKSGGSSHLTDTVGVDRQIAEDPGNPLNYLIKADLMFREKLHGEAVDNYLKAASMLREQGFFGKALAIYKVVSKIDYGNEAAATAISEMIAAHPISRTSTPLKSLDNSIFLSLLSPEEIRDLLESSEVKTFSAGGNVVKEGDRGDCVYVVKKGTATVESTVMGKKITYAPLSPGDFFGEIALFTNGFRTASVIAEGDLEVYEITKPQIEKLLGKNPEVLYFLDNLQHQRLNETMKNIDELKGAMAEAEKAYRHKV
ncbi:MAG: cyclic nucleotide-binding domain-containing protein [Nitrospirae bacterium]|nr:cyclic nucleotide-binding domain-containing protein [Nitrospirota bacterium]